MGDYNQELKNLSDQIADLHVRVDELFTRHFEMMRNLVEMWKEHNDKLAELVSGIKQ